MISMKPNMMLHKGAVAKLQSTGRLATAPWGRLHKEGEVLILAILAISFQSLAFVDKKVVSWTKTIEMVQEESVV